MTEQSDILSLSEYFRDDFDDAQPRILDLELGRRLEFARVDKVRDLVRSLKRSGKLSNLHQITVAVRREDGLPSKPATEFWLTKKQALKVIMRSETDVADRIQDEIIDIFDAYTEGRIAPIPLFAAEKRSWRTTWKQQLPKLLCKLKGEPFDGGHPFWAQRHYSIIYECVLGAERYEELKQRNPNPQKGSNHHQHLTEEAVALLEQHLDKVATILEVSHSLPAFIANLRFVYQHKPMQLPLMALPPGAAE